VAQPFLKGVAVPFWGVPVPTALRKGLVSEINLLARAGIPLRMDPLSMTASISAIMQLAQRVANYLNDMKDASKEQVRIATEISSVNALLTPSNTVSRTHSLEIPGSLKSKGSETKEDLSISSSPR